MQDKMNLIPEMKIFKQLIIVALMLCPFILMAQPNSTSPSSAAVFEEINDVPIDGAIALLGLAGAGFGIRALYRQKR